MSRALGVPVGFEVESLSLNHVALRNLRMGRSVRVSRLLILFYPDALLLRRELEYVRAVGVRVSVPDMAREFSQGKEESGKGKGGKGGGASPFAVKEVAIYDLGVVPTDSVEVRVKSSRFSYQADGGRVKVSNLRLRGLTVSTLPPFRVDSAFGDMVTRRGTLYVRLSAVGKYDTLAIDLRDGRMASYSVGDTASTRYDFRELSVMGGGIALSVKRGKALWKVSPTTNRVGFSVGEVVWADTLKVEEIEGNLVLDSLPDWRLEGVRGRAYGGRFKLDLSSDSSKVFRVGLDVRGVRWGGLLTVSGGVLFSLDLRDSSLVGGGRLDYLRLNNPATELGGMDFSFESRGLKRYDFNLLGDFVSAYGYYDLSNDEGSLTFNLDRPLRGISYGDFRLYTFSAAGKAVKRGSLLKVSLSDAKLWYAVYDTLRLDSLFARNLNLELDLNRPQKVKSSGEVTLFYSQRDSAVASVRYAYSPSSFALEGDVRTATYGSLRLSAAGRVPDSILLSSVSYDNRSLHVRLRDILFRYGDTLLLTVPENTLLGGKVRGTVGLVADSSGYSFLEGSQVTLLHVNPTPVFGTFFPDLDLLVEDVSLRLEPHGSVGEAEVNGELKVKGVSYGDIPIDSLRANYHVGGDVVGVDSAFVWVENSAVEVEVGRYYPPLKALYVFARSRNFPTDRFMPFLLPDSGRLTFELSVSGRIDSPNVLGFLYWTAKSLDLNGNFVRRPSIYAVGMGNRLVLPAFKDTNVAFLGGGKVRFNGSISTALTVDSLKVSLEKAEVQADPDITAVLNGDLKITGDLKREIMVAGEVVADEVEIFKPLTEMATGGATSSSSKPVVLYDIHFYAPRRIFLNSTLTSQALTGALLEIDAELSADINAQKLSPTLSSLSGTLSFLRGNVYIVDKVFHIDRGEIVLYGTEGTINILSSATFPRSVQNGLTDSVRVFVSIEGDMQHPNVRIWSQPYMSTGEILALIVGGSNVLGFLSRGLKWGLNLSELSIKQTPTSYQLLFGTYITRRVYLKSTLSTTGDFNSIRTLYFVNPHLSIYGERIQEPEGTRYGVGINYRIRF